MGSLFGAFWEDPEDGFIKLVIKRASKQVQVLHMEGKLHVILYFRVVCVRLKSYDVYTLYIIYLLLTYQYSLFNAILVSETGIYSGTLFT